MTKARHISGAAVAAETLLRARGAAGASTAASPPLAASLAATAAAAAAGVPSLAGSLGAVVRTVLKYAIAHVLLDKFVWQRVLSHDRLNSMTRRDRLFLAEKILSSVNSVYVSKLAYDAIFQKGRYDINLLETYPPEALQAFQHLCGYSIYDMAVMWLQGGEHWSMWVHHLMSLYGTALMMYFKKPSFYPLLYAGSEITALTNNVVWYAQRLVPHRRHRLMLTLRALAFIAARVWILPYALYRTADHAHFHLPTLVRQWGGLHPVAAVLTAINVVTIGYFNLGWSYAMCKIAFRAIMGRPHRAKAD